MIWPIIIAFFVFGLMLGSFATALAWRVPQDISVVRSAGRGKVKAARSQCPHCQKKLGARDLFPLFSWLFSKGRCRQCGAKISATYPLIELATGLAAVGVFLSWGAVPQSLFLVALLPFLMALIVIDLKHMILPDKLVLICALIGCLRFIFLFQQQDYDFAVLQNYLGAAVFYAMFACGLAFVMSKVLKKDAMGMGDVKFYLVAGLWLGFSYFAAFLIFAGALGVLVGLVWRRISGYEAFPFGPALILSLYSCLIFEGLGITPFVGL
jgi:prepilin signal peptidase PulO-like enzyme (type II secretory pathway)